VAALLAFATSENTIYRLKALRQPSQA